MGKGNYRSQRYLKINLRFSEKIKNDTYSKCDVKCRIVSYKENYYDFFKTVFPIREQSKDFYYDFENARNDAGTNFTMILNPEQGTYSELCPPARFSPAEILLFSTSQAEIFHKIHPESGKADPKPA